MDASSLCQDSLPLSSDALIGYLDQAGFSYERIDHVPLRTVADSKQVRDGFLSEKDGGGHIKNLFLRDKKKNSFLVVLPEDKDVDLRQLAEKIGAGRLSFGSADRLLEMLGVRPGAVTPLSMLTGRHHNVTLIMDATLQDRKLIYMHPLVNDRTIAMSPEDTEAFLASYDCMINWTAL